MNDAEYQVAIDAEMASMTKAKATMEVLKNALVVAAIQNDGVQIDGIRLQLHAQFDVLLDSTVSAVTLVQARGRANFNKL